RERRGREADGRECGSFRPGDQGRDEWAEVLAWGGSGRRAGARQGGSLDLAAAPGPLRFGAGMHSLAAASQEASPASQEASPASREGGRQGRRTAPGPCRRGRRISPNAKEAAVISQNGTSPHAR